MRVSLITGLYAPVYVYRSESFPAQFMSKILYKLL
jgi:hypothetical protein